MGEFREKMQDAERVRAGETVLPAFVKEAFHCQLCRVFAAQQWSQPDLNEPIHKCRCSNCGGVSYWFRSALSKEQPAKMIYPYPTSAPLAHPDMPEDVVTEYSEAASIVGLSPRGAGALLRLALQKLMPHLGETGRNLNTDIAALVTKGLDPHVQMALDALRVIGNSAVHPLELDIRDDQETVGALFGLLNFIVEDRIARPRKLAALYAALPEGAREAIERRDSP